MAALKVELYSSPSDYLQRKHFEGPSCIVLDVRLPGSSGLDFQRELVRKGVQTPVIFLTGHADIAMGVQAMKSGAVEFLTKPYRDQALLEAVLSGIERDRARRESEGRFSDILKRLESLTRRERQVMALAAAGEFQQANRREIGDWRRHREGSSPPGNA